MHWTVVLFSDFFSLFFLWLPSRFFKALVGFKSHRSLHTFRTKSWWIPHCWSFDTACFQAVFHRSGVLLRDRDARWFFISYLLVVMYIQFVELQGCSVKLVVTLYIFITSRLPSSRPFRGKKMNLKYYVLFCLFHCRFSDHRQIFLFSLR